MAKQPASTNGHASLQEQLLQGQVAMQQAVASLISNQAAFVAETAQIRREAEEVRRDMRRLERELNAKHAEVIRILNEHTRLFERLPEAVREKIGFQTPKA